MPYDEVGRLLSQSRRRAEMARQRNRTLAIQNEPAAAPLAVEPDPLEDDLRRVSWASTDPSNPPPDPLDDAIASESAPAPSQGWADLAITQGLRIIPPTVGSILGVAGPTAAAGGAAGTLIGEPIAQAYEISRGLRPGFSPKELATETALSGALSVIPGGRTLARAGLMGAGMGAGSEVARGLLNEGEMPELGRVATAGGLGALFGGATKLGVDAAGRLLRRPPRVVSMEPVEAAPREPPLPVAGRPTVLTPEQEIAQAIADHAVPIPRRPIDLERVGPRYVGERRGMVEGEPWGGWPGPVEPEATVIRPRPPAGIPQPRSSLEPRGLLPPGEPAPPLPDVTPIGGRPGPEVGEVPFALRREIADVPPPRQPDLALADDLARASEPVRPVARPAPVAEVAPAPTELPVRQPGEEDLAEIPKLLRITMRAGRETRAADVQFPRTELEELFRASNRVSGKAVRGGKVTPRLSNLKDWIEQTFEVDLKTRGEQGLAGVAARYRKAVLDAVREAKPGEPVQAPDLELFLPNPRSAMRQMYRQAKQEGFEGTPEQLRDLAGMEEVQATADDPDAGGGSDLAFLKAVANVGGLRHEKGAMYSEVAAWLKDLSTAPIGEGQRARLVASIKSKPGSKRYLQARMRLQEKFEQGQNVPIGRIQGIPVYNAISGHKSMDSLAEALAESYPHLVPDTGVGGGYNARDVADRLQDAVGRVHARPPEKAFGPNWWRKYGPPEPDTLGYPPEWDELAGGADVSPVRTEPQPDAGLPAARMDVEPGAPGAPGAEPTAGPEPPRRPDWGSEAGGAATRAMVSLSGGLAGAGYGGATGDTPEERLSRALTFGALGAGAGLTLGGLSRRPVSQRPPPVPSRPVAPPGPLQRGAGAPPPPGRLTVPGEMRTRGRVEPSQLAPIPPAGRIKPERLAINVESLPAPIQESTRTLLEELNFLQRHRRGVQSHERTTELAKRIEVDFDKTLPAGTALNAETKQAYGMAYARVAQDTLDLARKIRADKARGVTSESDLFDLARLQAQEIALFKSWRGATTEAGRALEASKIMKQMLPWERQVWLAAKRKAGDLDQMEALADRLADNPDPYAVYAKARDSQGMTKGEFWQNYFLTNILSGVNTQLRNTFGNAANLTFRQTVVPALRVPVDIAWSRITGAERQVFAGDVMQRWIGMHYAFGGAIADAAHVLRNGFSKLQVDDMIAAAEGIDLGRKEFRGGGANIMNWVGRGMDAADRFFLTLNKGAAERAYLYNRSVSALKQRNAQVTPDSLAAEMMSQKSRLADDKEARGAILREALEGVYREPLGPAAQRLQMLKGDVPGMGYIIPFVKTVSNIFRQGYEHTPVSLVVKAAKAKRAGTMEAFGKTRGEQEMMIAKGAFGTLAATPLAYLAATGQMSGNGPTDRAERQQLMDSGWRPNSILLPLSEPVAKALGASKSDTGKYWVNYALFQPLSIPMSLTANAFEAMHNIERSREKATVDLMPTREIAQALQGIANSALSQSYLNGLFSMVQAVQADASMADAFITDLAKGFVPMSGLLRGIARTQDRFVRKPRGLAQSIMADLPFGFEDVPTRTGRYGEPIERRRPAWARGWMVPEIEGQIADPVDMELNRLGVYVPRPLGRVEIRDRAGNLRKLSQADEQMAEEARGTARRAMLTQVMQSPAYEQQPDLVKRLLIRRALNQASRFGAEAARYGIVRQDRALLDQLLAPARRIASGSTRRGQ